MWQTDSFFFSGIRFFFTTMRHAEEQTLEELEAQLASATDPESRMTALLDVAEKIYRTDMIRAIDLATEALQLARTYNFPDAEIGALTTMGMAFAMAGHYDNALEQYQQSLFLCDKYNNSREEAYIHGNLAGLYNNLGDNEKALAYSEKALQYHIKEKSYRPIHVNYTNMGVYYNAINDLENALLCYDNALSYCELSGHLPSKAIILANRGTVYARKGELQTALEHFLQAYNLNSSLNLNIQCSRDLINIARVYFEWNDHSRAFEYAEKATRTAEECGSKLAQMQVYQSLSHMYERAKNWEAFAQAFKRFYILEKEVKSEETQKKAANLDMQRQLDRKEAERHATEKILHKILPLSIAERIKTGDEEIIERYENCSVLFADIVDFTLWSSGMEVKELGRQLNRLFQMFDELALQYGVEKIKTIGDAYMCVAGLPEPCGDHAERIARMALAMQQQVKTHSAGLRLRIGLHAGEVIAGVLGKNKYAYDLWGDTVNTASRMESYGLPDTIHITGLFKKLLPARFNCQPRGEIDIKGKGKISTWFLVNELMNA